MYKQLLMITAASSAVSIYAADRPNILWLTSEDNNVGWIGCYGNDQATTPNIDKLATEGFRYTNCFANAPVCAPSRSTWITGVNALSMGTHPMRSRYEIPHDTIKYYPDLLKKSGYFVSNHTKTDYNIGGRDDKECWDSSDKYAWRKRKPGQSFFCIINNTNSHESKAQGKVENTQHKPEDMKLHAYHPDLPNIRKNYAKYADAVQKMDGGIGEALAELEKDGLADDTIVIYCSDHGGVLPRSKRYLFDSGIHAPLIVRIPEKYKHLWPADKPGMTVDRLVSFVDMPKTWLSLTGSETPSYLQGTTFLGENKEQEQPYHFAFRARMDERPDNQRAVRDKRFLFIKNYMPYVPWGQRLQYLWKMVASQEWDKHHLAGKTDAITGRFFTNKPSLELYDTSKDSDNINNLAYSPEYKEVVARMDVALNSWQKKIYDAGMLPEAEVAKRASDNGLTIYEMVRKPELYNLSAYLDAADIALEREPENMDELLAFLAHSDSGVRYWGVVGLFLLNEKAQPAKDMLISLLKDDSHEVRALAAWTVFRMDEKESALDCLKELLESKSYALLTVTNIMDQIGDEAKSLYPSLAKVSFSKAESNSLTGYVLRMKDNLLGSNESAKKKGKRKKKK